MCAGAHAWGIGAGRGSAVCAPGVRAAAAHVHVHAAASWRRLCAMRLVPPDPGRVVTHAPKHTQARFRHASSLPPPSPPSPPCPGSDRRDALRLAELEVVLAGLREQRTEVAARIESEMGEVSAWPCASCARPAPMCTCVPVRGGGSVCLCGGLCVCVGGASCVGSAPRPSRAVPNPASSHPYRPAPPHRAQARSLQALQAEVEELQEQVRGAALHTRVHACVHARARTHARGKGQLLLRWRWRPGSALFGPFQAAEQLCVQEGLLRWSGAAVHRGARPACAPPQAPRAATLCAHMVSWQCNLPLRCPCPPPPRWRQRRAARALRRWPRAPTSQRATRSASSAWGHGGSAACGASRHHACPLFWGGGSGAEGLPAGGAHPALRAATPAPLPLSGCPCPCRAERERTKRREELVTRLQAKQVCACVWWWWGCSLTAAHRHSMLCTTSLCTPPPAPAKPRTRGTRILYALPGLPYHNAHCPMPLCPSPYLPIPCT